jgi:hypothetical protein
MKRIKYISTFAKRFSPDDMLKLVGQSAANNKRHNITGVLLASSGVFFQIVEGPDEQVDHLYDSLVGDKRHDNLLLLSVESGDLTRLFPKWSMQKIDLDLGTGIRSEPLRAILHAIFQQRRIADDLTATLERSIWNFVMENGGIRQGEPTQAPAPV